MLDHVDFNAPEPPQFFVSPKGNLLYQRHYWDKKRQRVRGFGWRAGLAPWAGLKAVIVRCV